MRSVMAGLLAVTFVTGLFAADAKPGVSTGQVKDSVEKGISWLRKQQNPDGSYGDPRRPDVGITALALHAIAGSPKKYRTIDGPFITKTIDYLRANMQEDGSIMNKNQGLANYKTSVAIMAFAALEDEELEPIIKKAQDFIVGLQCAEPSGYDKDKHKAAYGGIGYGGDQRPDLSNLQIALDALKASGLSEDHKAWERATVFLNRVQNRSESNDMESALNDGGFMYYPGNSKAGTVKLPNGKEGHKSYGSMTYAGLKSFIYANVKKDDPRVQAAYGWIKQNYTLEENPGLRTDAQPDLGKQGLYYYYYTFAKSLAVYGEPMLVEADGKERDWAAELAARLISVQKPEGNWKNEKARWWEGDKTLVTSYAIMALNVCHDELKKREKK